MKNPNAPIARFKRSLLARWSREDYPGAEPRFQLTLLGKDIAVFVLLPVLAVILFKSLEDAATAPRRPQVQYTKTANSMKLENEKSQIIDFRGPVNHSMTAGFSKRAPGTLVKLRLLNVVETYANAPVHAQIIDTGLGQNLVGGTLLGDGVSDTSFNRILITFHFARDSTRENIAVPVAARALSLDGTLGLEAKQKEGFFARSTLSAASPSTQNIQSKTDGLDFNQMVFKAMATGFLQEFSNTAGVEKNRAAVLSLQPGKEFFAELTDFFPGSTK